jgi:glutamyl-tRNA synthetase
MMEITGDTVSHSSDFFELLSEYAIKIIKAGKAYADDTDGELVSLRSVHGIVKSHLVGLCSDETAENGRHPFEEP